MKKINRLDAACTHIAVSIIDGELAGVMWLICAGIYPDNFGSRLKIITVALDINVNIINPNSKSCNPHGYERKYFIFLTKMWMQR